MPENDIWEHDTLEVGEDGHVEGSAYTREKHGHSVDAGVYSYEYSRGGEARMNHVPIVTVTDDSGRIVAEPHAHDSEDAESAIDHAKSAGAFAFENLGEFI